MRSPRRVRTTSPPSEPPSRTRRSQSAHRHALPESSVLSHPGARPAEPALPLPIAAQPPPAAARRSEASPWRGAASCATSSRTTCETPAGVDAGKPGQIFEQRMHDGAERARGQRAAGPFDDFQISFLDFCGRRHTPAASSPRAGGATGSMGTPAGKQTPLAAGSRPAPALVLHAHAQSRP